MAPATRLPIRLIIPAVLVALIAAAWAFGLTGYLSWAWLAGEQRILTGLVAAHPLAAPLLYLAIYVASVTLSLPQAGLLTILGGLLFGALIGAALAICGATAGAILLFLIARSAFAGSLAKRGGGALAKLREELRQDGFSYLLALRLVPLFPFWLINLAAALCGMKLRPFALATFVGIIPTTVITASVGAGFGGLLAQGQRPDASILFTWPILGPLVALAAVSLTPLIWRKWRSRYA